MKRRDFVTLLGGTGVWSLAAQAQPTKAALGLTLSREFQLRADEVIE